MKKKYWRAVCKTCGWQSDRFPNTGVGYAAAVSKKEIHLNETREITETRIAEHLVEFRGEEE